MAVATNGTTQVFTSKVVNLSSLQADRVLLDGEIATGALGGRYKVSIADGATVTLRDAVIEGEDSYSSSWAGLTCLGDATVVLEGTNAVKGFYHGYPGLFVPSGKTLTIRGGGSLDANGGSDDAPGIGATGDAACGTIVIEGGTIHATGTGEAAGIGCGRYNSASCDGIVIRGGTVVAQGGGDMSDDGGGAGIGGTYGTSFGSVVIDGGTVTAYGGYFADGIGLGDGDVVINGGTVTAYGGSYGSGIGGCDNVVVNSGTVVADGGAECPGIGGGCASVVIAGGTVTAVGGPDGAGIGGGTYTSCGPVTIGPDIVRVTATCDDASGCCPIGDGYGGTCGTVTVAFGLRDTTTDLTRVLEGPGLLGSGTAADPCRIASAADWDALGSLLESGVDSAGVHFLLVSNLVVTAEVGTVSHPFAGTFDGGGYTLTANLSGTNAYLAPFSVIDGAAISNLVVSGTVNGGMHCAGLVGFAVGTNRIENCRVTTSVTASGTHCGGIVGHGGTSATTIAGCVFAGSFSGASTVGTLWGWSDAGAAPAVIDCIDATYYSHPIGRGDAESLRVENVYYRYSDKSTGGSSPWPEGKRGKRACPVWSEGFTPDFGTPAATYDTSGIVAYAPGLHYNGTFYAGESDEIEFVVTGLSSSATERLSLESIGDTLTQNGDVWTLAMPSYNVTLVLYHEFLDGAVLSGDYVDGPKIVIADGATVTLSNAVIEASGCPGSTCRGNAVIVLEGSNTVSCSSDNPGIRAGESGSTLVIRGPGYLSTAGGEYAPAIGYGQGHIVIEGGTIEAIGGEYGTGIGDCSSVLICGGTVTARGGADRAGIGGNCMSILICGGTVTARGGEEGGAGIGSGSGKYAGCGQVVILGGTVDAVGGSGAAGLGCGYGGFCTGIYVTEGVSRVTATKGAGAPFSIGKGADYIDESDPDNDWYSNCMSVSIGGNVSEGIVQSPYTYTGTSASATFINLSQLTADYTAQDGDILLGWLPENFQLKIADGASVVLCGVTIGNNDSNPNTPWAGITCLGDASLFLVRENYVSGLCDGYPGIQAGPADKTLVIDGAGGSLLVMGRAGAPGIGGATGSACGDISFAYGIGEILAHGGDGAPGDIGPALNGTGGAVSVDDRLLDMPYEYWEVGDVRRIVRPIDMSQVHGMVQTYYGEVLTGRVNEDCTIMIDGNPVTFWNLTIEHGRDNSLPGVVCGDAEICLVGTNAVTTVCDGVPAIYVAQYSSLTICGDGVLIATSTGGGAAGGGEGAAGIGSGPHGECDGILIAGGIVRATGGESAAGIGCGYDSFCETIDIRDSVTLVVAQAGEPVWDDVQPCSVGASSGGASGDVIVGGVNTGDIHTPRFVYPEQILTGTVDLSGVLANSTVRDGTTLYGAIPDDCMIRIEDGATVTLSNATIRVNGGLADSFGGYSGGTVRGIKGQEETMLGAGITCLGSATIILVGTNEVSSANVGYPGIQAGGGSNTQGGSGSTPKKSSPGECVLEICGDGALTVQGGSYAAGIGSGYDDTCGDIVISGGTVFATGVGFAVGIGAGNSGTCGDITISGGAVTALRRWRHLRRHHDHGRRDAFHGREFRSREQRRFPVGRGGLCLRDRNRGRSGDGQHRVQPVRVRTRKLSLYRQLRRQRRRRRDGRPAVRHLRCAEPLVQRLHARGRSVLRVEYARRRQRHVLLRRAARDVRVQHDALRAVGRRRGGAHAGDRVRRAGRRPGSHRHGRHEHARRRRPRSDRDGQQRDH